MRATLRKTAELGEVVAAAFDTAAHYSNDRREVSLLATRAIAQMLRPRPRQPAIRRWPALMAGDLL